MTLKFRNNLVLGTEKGLEDWQGVVLKPKESRTPLENENILSFFYNITPKRHVELTENA